MPCPTPQEYDEAVQNPALVFSDPDLRASRPALTPLGLPRPVTGNFASVYRLMSGNRSWAVRCFWRDFPDTQERYVHIGRYLQTRRMGCMVSFDYLAQGILVGGRRHPILKMEWLEGDLLHDYVHAHLQHPGALRALRMRWVDLVGELEAASVAHGDLQHGNVVVHGGELRLVDYDGMYVPSMRGLHSHELGHSNYQHPARQGSHFGPYLDRFAAWVIYLSLLAFELDPDLWTSSGAGDEQLLFRRGDFEQPSVSPTIRALSHHADRRLRSATLQFLECLDADLAAVPPVSTVASEPALSRRRRFLPPWRQGRPVRERPAPVDPSPSLPLWLHDYVQDGRALARNGLGENQHRAAWRRVSSRLRAACLVVEAVRARRHHARAQYLHAWWQRRQRRWLDRLEALDARLERRLEAIDMVERDMVSPCVELAALTRRRHGHAEAAVLAMVREQQRLQFLRSHRVWTADIPGVSKGVRAYMWLRGIRSAADMRGARCARLNRLSGRRAAALLAWRCWVDTESRRIAPSALDDALHAELAAPYVRFQARTARLIDVARECAEQVRRATRESVARDRAQLEAAMAREEARFRRRTEWLSRQATPTRRRLLRKGG